VGPQLFGMRVKGCRAKFVASLPGMEPGAPFRTQLPFSLTHFRVPKFALLDCVTLCRTPDSVTCVAYRLLTAVTSLLCSISSSYGL
jgi:hypothetical protein